MVVACQLLNVEMDPGMSIWLSSIQQMCPGTAWNTRHHHLRGISGSRFVLAQLCFLASEHFLASWLCSNPLSSKNICSLRPAVGSFWHNFWQLFILFIWQQLVPCGPVTQNCVFGRNFSKLRLVINGSNVLGGCGCGCDSSLQPSAVLWSGSSSFWLQLEVTVSFQVAALVSLFWLAIQETDVSHGVRSPKRYTMYAHYKSKLPAVLNMSLAFYWNTRVSLWLQNV